MMIFQTMNQVFIYTSLQTRKTLLITIYMLIRQTTYSDESLIIVATFISRIICFFTIMFFDL